MRGGVEVPEIARLQQKVEELTRQDERHELELERLRHEVAECNRELLREIKALREEIKSLYNRLPTWATVVFGLFCSVIGVMVGAGGGI